ncbi:type I pantothenate kinase [Evansella clarkii]|uniref:type I pantothenate kinase n=1 Tax=Evansella clarkii TaxID=79879 RepID=UPI000B452ED8|nr:type I pantothenate kinase [Evansella clarkii]
MTAKTYSPYMSFTREEWADFRNNTPLTITEQEIEKLQGINENISLDEVEEIYLPLIRFLSFTLKAAKQLHKVTDEFFQQETQKVPYIIGVAGSVAVGKSTTSRILQSLLAGLPEAPKVDLVTTDGFLYPNKILKERGLLEKKGFPESYDIKGLIHFLTELKSGNAKAYAPVYSHLHYDIIPGEYIEVSRPDIVIIEGINVLQPPKQEGNTIPSLFVSDFFDISIYVDAEEKHIFNWYVERFKLLKKTAFTQPESYFNRYASLSDEEADEVAAEIWNKINKKNLDQNINPTKSRADIIIKKGMDHRVDNIELRKI